MATTIVCDTPTKTQTISPAIPQIRRLTQEAAIQPTTTTLRKKTGVILEQLELILVTETSTTAQKYKPCAEVLSGNSSMVIPGADADLCRCPACLSSAPGGIWWVDQKFRKDWFDWRSGEYKPNWWISSTKKDKDGKENGAIALSSRIRLKQLAS